MKILLITNNPLVEQKYKNVSFINGSLLDILIETRNYIHKGHKLLMHPLAGSIKPNQTPYKSIVLNNLSEKLDFKSLELIENAIETVRKFQVTKKQVSDFILHDYQVIDLSLLEAALESLNK